VWCEARRGESEARRRRGGEARRRFFRRAETLVARTGRAVRLSPKLNRNVVNMSSTIISAFRTECARAIEMMKGVLLIAFFIVVFDFLVREGTSFNFIHRRSHLSICRRNSCSARSVKVAVKIQSSFQANAVNGHRAKQDGYALSKFNIANALTVARVVAVPFFMLALVMKKKSIGVLIYIASCATDFLDGYLARKLKLHSQFGAFLDPVADKLMVATALIMLVCQLPTWWFACPVSVIILREISVSALREWMAQKGRTAIVKVGYLGKLKTAFQMVSTAALLEACPGTFRFDLALSLGISRSFLFSIGLILLYASTALTVLSGMQYFVAAWPVLREEAAI
jgi:CDP-diacylglycerol---glycerol-3-phosphate 3-phosphatidyltransferase